MNMTLDGFCDHTSMSADEELHLHYSDLLKNSGTLIYGRTTYQLMENYWPAVVKSPTGDKATDDFAVAIDNIEKIVFSNTLNSVGWKNVKLAKRSVKEEVSELKRSSSGGSKDIVVGSPSMIVQCAQLGLVDEYQICVHPVIAGKGLTLFKTINDGINLKLLKTKKFSSGAIMLCYEPAKK